MQTILAMLIRYSSYAMLCLGVAAGFIGQVEAQSSREVAELTMRVDRLEAQIRELTGQLERLTFALQNQSQGQGQNQLQPEPVSPPATPPQNLGSLPAQQSGGSLALQPQQGRPLDLSALAGGPSLQNFQGQNLPGQDFNSLPQNDAASANDALPTAITAGSPRQEYELAYGHITRGEYELAEGSLREFLAKYPNDPLVGDALFWLGESLFARGQYREAATQFLKVYTDHPQGAKTPDSLLKLGMSLDELGERQAACSTYGEFVRKYPAAPPPLKQRVREQRQAADCI